MTELNYLTMLSAIREALEKPMMKIGVFAATQKRAGDVALDFYEAIEEDPCKKSCVNYRDCGANGKSIITFKNGSGIEIMSAHPGACGRRYHKIFYEKEIRSSVTHEILAYMESLPYDKTILKWRL